MSFVPDLKQRNLPEQLADHIVLLIAKGEIRAGQRLVEKDVCTMLGVSRIPVREALRTLQAQGVLHGEPNRGTFVTQFGSEEMKELLEVRLHVERMALKRVRRLYSAREVDLGELDAAVAHMREKAGQDDWLAFCRADLSFHRCLVELSGSPLLRPIWDSLSRGILVFLMQERDLSFDFKRSLEDHEFIVELIRAENETALDREIDRHVLRSSASARLAPLSGAVPASPRFSAGSPR